MRKKLKFCIRIVLIIILAVLCVFAGILAWIFLIPSGDDVGMENPEYEEVGDIPVYEQPLEEKLKTRGLLKIYFENTDYIYEINEYMDAKVDSLRFYDDQGIAHGVILSSHGTFQTTFPVQEIKFHSEILGQDGAFTFTYPGEVLNLKIDYKDETFEIYKDEKEVSD